MKRQTFENLSVLIVLLFLIHCDRIPDNRLNPAINCEGLCIYLTEVEITSDLTYQTFDVENAPLLGDPVIAYKDIISYWIELHVIQLSYSRDSLLSKIQPVSVYGKPFIVTLDGEKLYGGWFWTGVSSIPCHSVMIVVEGIPDSLKDNEIRIELGGPNENYFIGIDPRTNQNIIDRLTEDEKAK